MYYTSKTKTSVLIQTVIFYLLFLKRITAQSTKSANSTQEFTEPPKLRADHIENNRPIIGIIAHEFTRSYGHGYHDTNPCYERYYGNSYYVSSNMVKLLESSGSRVVPIMANRNEKYLQKMFNSVNGIVFPGAVVNMRTSSYARAGKFLYNLAVESNDRGLYFPLWGECYGFQFMLFTASGSQDLNRDRCNFLDYSAPIEFTEYAKDSRLFGDAPKNIKTLLRSVDVGYHNHKYCIVAEHFDRYKFNPGQKFRPLTLNNDEKNGRHIVSSVEAINYPFYSLGFHPETNLFTWDLNSTIPHSKEAVLVAQYLGNFFIGEARKNDNHFETEEEEKENLMFNFQTYCEGKLYIFPKK